MSLPDEDSIMKEVRELSAQTRENMKQFGKYIAQNHPSNEASQAVSGSVAAPIYLGKADFIPVKYILHFSQTHCTNCGTIAHESKFYAMNFIRSRVTGQHIRHMVPTDRPLYNVPVERIQLRNYTAPFCAECETIDLSHLPPPPQAALVYDLEEPRLKGQRPKEGVKKETPKKATLDDLA